MPRNHVTASTLCEAFQHTASRNPDRIALRTPGEPGGITWRQYDERAREIAAGLSALGVRAGDTVALMLTNRPEFHLVDVGALHAGATPFSIYNTFAPEQVQHVLADAGSTVVVCEERFVAKVRASLEGTEVKHLVCVDGSPEGTLAFDDLEADPEFDAETTWRGVRPEDVLTIIYTSGTTGPPKGVELTHAGMLAEVDATLEILPVDASDSVVSYLPDAHVANRWGAHYTSMCSGMQITTVADMKRVLDAVTDVRPTFFGAVPQVWYKVKAALESTIAAERSPIKRGLTSWALHVGRRKVRMAPRRPSLPLRLQVALADRLVLSTIRAKLGFDRVRIAASGAAPIAPEALEFVLALGIPVCEGWGMSEVSGVGAINPPDDIRIGTVGLPIKDVEATLGEDGELLVRGPVVMRGYRNKPDKTAETIDAQGWLHTGDIATIDSDGYISIVDRKKELIINSAGKNMSPTSIEDTIKVACPLIGFVTVIGDNRPYMTALITLDPEAAAEHAAQHGHSDTSAETLADDPGVYATIEAGVKAANNNLARVEQIKKFTILPTFWEPGGDEVTPSVKLKREPIAKKYATEIEALYA